MQEAPLPARAILPSDVAAAVERIERSGILPDEGHSRRLLRYLATHATGMLSGSPPRSRDIALDVLGLSESFDPTTTPDVRAEVGKLRRLLDAYAAGVGADDPVRLWLPRGSLGLQIARRDPSPRPDAVSKARAEAKIERLRLLLLLALLPLLAVSLYLLSTSQRDPAPDFPVVRIDPFMGAMPDRRMDWLLLGIESQMIAELSQHRMLRVVATRSDGQQGGDYALSGLVAGTAEAPLLRLVLSRLPSDAVFWSRDVLLADSGAGLPAAVQDTVRALVGEIAAPFGAIPSDSRDRLLAFDRRWSDRPPTEFLCLMRWQSFDIGKDGAERDRARSCLSALTAAGTRNGSVWAAHAFMVLLDWTESGARPSDPALARAEAAATRAVALDPSSSDAHESLGSILSVRGQGQAARSTLLRAEALNPSNPEIRVKLGWEDCRAGDWDGGIARITAVIGSQSVVPGWYRIPLSLNAFRTGDTATALFEAERILATGDPRGAVLLLAAARRANDLPAIARAEAAIAARGLTPVLAWSELRAVFPDAALSQAYVAVLAADAPPTASAGGQGAASP